MAGAIAVPAGASKIDADAFEILRLAAGQDGTNVYLRTPTNTQGTLLASAARTATTTSTNQTNANSRGVQLSLKITAASGTGGLQVLVLGIDPVSSQAYQLNASPTAITATGLYVYELYPDAGTAGTAGAGLVNQRTAGSLPLVWGAKVIHGDTSSYTYSLGYSLNV